MNYLLDKDWQAIIYYNFIKHFELIQIPNFDLILYVSLVIIPVMLIELKFCKFKETSFFRIFFQRSKSTWHDIIMWIFHLTRIEIVIAVFLSMLLYPHLTTYVGNIVPEKIQLNIKNSTFSYFFYLIWYDFVVYWRHRLSHKIKIWWNIHKYHHSAEEFNIITAYRIHPFEIFLHSTFIAITMAVVAAPVESIYFIGVVIGIQGGLQHSGINSDWGFIGKYIFLSPQAHRIHHSNLDCHVDKNFGHILVIFDRVFGTWYDGKVVNKKLGVQDNFYNKSNILFELIYPAKMFFKDFYSKMTFNSDYTNDIQSYRFAYKDILRVIIFFITSFVILKLIGYF